MNMATPDNSKSEREERPSPDGIALRDAGRKRPTNGKIFVRLCGAALAFNLLLVVILLSILIVEGIPGFWQRPVIELTLKDGRKVLGELIGKEPIPKDESVGSTGESLGDRIKLKVGNKELQEPFVWIPESDVASRAYPEDAVLFERSENGHLYGRPKRLRRGDTVVTEGGEATLAALQSLTREKEQQRDEIQRLEEGDVADVTYQIREFELKLRGIERKLDNSPSEELTRDREVVVASIADLKSEFTGYDERLMQMREALLAEVLVVEVASGEEWEQVAGKIEHYLSPNKMSFFDRLGTYARRLWQFLSEKPREANTEGGILPAIFGTVMMVILMSLVAVPLGVLAAVYLREYATQGVAVRIVRIAVNNLAGTPSIVFGIFGLGFFVYFVGGGIDKIFYADSLPTSTFGTGGILWASLTLALLTVPVVIVATEEGLASVPNSLRQASLALGATKWETVRRVIIPAAAPAIMTGTILSMARAAGEVAPLMILGMVKMAPDLPLDGRFPFIHVERKFMHLGFHVFDLGFQTPDIEATRSLVFTTALLLIVIVTVMNLVAIIIRNRLRRRYAKSAV